MKKDQEKKDEEMYKVQEALGQSYGVHATDTSRKTASFEEASAWTFKRYGEVLEKLSK